jgi:hypothetical protein
MGPLACARCQVPTAPVVSERKPNRREAGGSAERDQLGSRAAQNRARVRRAATRTHPRRTATAARSRAQRARAPGRPGRLFRRLLSAHPGTLPRDLHRGVAIPHRLRLERLGLPDGDHRPRRGRPLDGGSNVAVSRTLATRHRPFHRFVGAHPRGVTGSAASWVRSAGTRPPDDLVVRGRVSTTSTNSRYGLIWIGVPSRMTRYSSSIS